MNIYLKKILSYLLILQFVQPIITLSASSKNLRATHSNDDLKTKTERPSYNLKKLNPPSMPINLKSSKEKSTDKIILSNTNQNLRPGAKKLKPLIETSKPLDKKETGKVSIRPKSSLRKRIIKHYNQKQTLSPLNMLNKVQPSEETKREIQDTHQTQASNPKEETTESQKLAPLWERRGFFKKQPSIQNPTDIEDPTT